MLDGTSVGCATSTTDTADLSILAGSPRQVASPFLIHLADTITELQAYRDLRHVQFVQRQDLFSRTDRDDTDDDPRTAVLVATADDGRVLGGVRLGPCTPVDIGWWSGSRLVVADDAHAAGIGAALVRAACAFAEGHDVLRFDATVQERYRRLFTSLGWDDLGTGPVIRGRSHRHMSWPIGRLQAHSDDTKSVLARALRPFAAQSGGLGPAGFCGDDGVPVPHSDFVAACDAIIPSMVERDPEWAGWCSVLVNLNDLSAMGADPVGMLDSVGAPSTAHLHRIIRGIADAAQMWRTPVLGGHTQLGVPAALSVTALGRTPQPVPGGGGRAGNTVSLVADLGGSWRAGYQGRQWDSTSTRSSGELVGMSSIVGGLRPAAAKDVSMAGLVGTLGMLAEASGTGAELDVAAIPRPESAAMGAWMTCFPGFAMLVADERRITDVPGPVTAAPCGRLTSQAGVRLHWPDGRTTTAVESTVTGLGIA
ncbi:MSMEG_0567/sll0787 family protein [Gordonia sp. DT219]|uniref:MSMEG_0567/sll0787 family protein n=1 Tax=Gordonia sp. DT219 TaxID=3416658 RepID=UPI003CE9D68F